MAAPADMTMLMLREIRSEMRSQRSLILGLTDLTRGLSQRIDRLDARVGELVARFPELEDSLGQIVKFELMGALANREAQQEQAFDAIEGMIERIDQELTDVHGREAQRSDDAASTRSILDKIEAALGTISGRVDKLEGESR